MTATMNDKLRGAEAVTGHTFSNPLILWEALQAAGSNVHHIGNRLTPDGNKRLAMLGDAVLKLALVTVWYNGEESKGRGQNIVSDVGSNANLNLIGRQNGLDQFVNNNPAQGRFVSPNTMASTVEAIVGAVYLDSGMDAVQRVMQALGIAPA